MRRLLRLKLLLAATLLTACTGLSVPPGQQDWEIHRQRLGALSHYTALGKIALRTPDQAESASLTWQQVGPATHLRLQGPMGIAATTVDSDGKVLEIHRDGEYSRWQLDDPNQDWDLPLKSLPHWLKGVPDPSLVLQAMDLDPTSQLPRRFEQQGWSVVFQGFGEFEGYVLPRRLEVSRGETRARIVLRRWEGLASSD